MSRPDLERRLLVRQAGPQDLATVWSITQAAYAEQRAQIGPQVGVFHETVEALQERLASGWTMLLAELDSRPVGVVRFSIRNGALAIGRLAVLPAQRRQGIGRALMAAAEAWGRAWGLSAATLGARADVPQSRPFYESLGYALVERLELRNSPGHDFYRMRKPLGGPTSAAPSATTLETYERYAPRFAQYARYDRIPARLEWFARLLPPPARVAEVGCGPGRDLRRLRALGYQVVGMDLTRAMLRLASDANTPLARADLRSLPCASGRFDGAWASASLLHLPRLEIAIAVHELRRILRPGGLALLTLKMGAGEEWQPTEDGPRFFSFYQPAEVRSLVTGAGFGLVRQWVDEPPPGQQVVWISTILQAMTATPAVVDKDG